MFKFTLIARLAVAASSILEKTPQLLEQYVPKNTDETIHGNVFVIPNSAAKISDFFTRSSVENHFKSLGLEVEEDELLVELWFTSEDSENWADHGHPVFKRSWSRFLPVRLFEDLKEGDKLTLNWMGQKVEITLNQSDFRYRRFGNFETVLSQVSA